MKRTNGVTDAKKKIIWERDQGICRYCSFPADCVDHVEPYSLQHNNSLTNLVLACNACNQIAGGQYLGTFDVKREHILAVRRPQIVAAFKLMESYQDD